MRHACYMYASADAQVRIQSCSPCGSSGLLESQTQKAMTSSLVCLLVQSHLWLSSCLRYIDSSIQFSKIFSTGSQSDAVTVRTSQKAKGSVSTTATTGRQRLDTFY